VRLIRWLAGGTAMWIAGFLAGLAAVFPALRKAASPGSGPEHGDREHGARAGAGPRPAAARYAVAAVEGTAGR